MKFKSYPGKRVAVPNRKEIIFGEQPYETKDEDEINALQKALEVVEVGGDGTDGSGQKIKIAAEQTLEPVTSPEADSLVSTSRSSVADELAQSIKERDELVIENGKLREEGELTKKELAEVKEAFEKAQKEGFPAGSTQAVSDAKEAVKEANDGKLSTEKSNLVDQVSRGNNRK